MISEINAYKILTYNGDFTERYSASFEDHVNKAIADGWEPLGGLCVWIPANGIPRFHQVIVKRVELRNLA